MKMPSLIIVVIVALVAAFAAYTYLKQPRPLSDRLGDAAHEVGNGNIGNAVDEAGAKTNGEKIQTDVDHATQPASSN